MFTGLEDTDRNRSFYRVMVGLWIFVGLAWVAGVISFVQELFMTLVQRAQMNLEKHNVSEIYAEKKIKNPLIILKRITQPCNATSFASWVERETIYLWLWSHTICVSLI